MQWWAWLGMAWIALALVGGLWLGATAQLAGARERAARRHRFEDEAGRHQSWWGQAG